ncbi:hypothetical protein H4V99_001797 [Cryobacterium sp. CG_9.6]|nr:hypothetical protein [Cryobacterium sp. CG_9.6]
MRDLLTRAARADAFDAHKLRQEAWRDFHGAWGHKGTTAQLIAWWADERRQRACAEWVLAHPGSKLADFRPFLDGIET